MSKAAYFLCHPGKEHEQSYDEERRFPWNSENHKRKFMELNGRIVRAASVDDLPQSSNFENSIFAWGEFEGDSTIEKIPPVKRTEADESDVPNSIHVPVSKVISDSDFAFFYKTRQNTDPWIFGENFIYSNCNQPSHKRRKSNLNIIDESRGEEIWKILKVC